MSGRVPDYHTTKVEWLECKAFMQMEFATNPTAEIKKCTRSAFLSGSGGGI